MNDRSSFSSFLVAVFFWFSRPKKNKKVVSERHDVNRPIRLFKRTLHVSQSCTYTHKAEKNSGFLSYIPSSLTIYNICRSQKGHSIPSLFYFCCTHKLVSFFSSHSLIFSRGFFFHLIFLYFIYCVDEWKKERRCQQCYGNFALSQTVLLAW